MSVMWHLSTDALRALAAAGDDAAEEELLRRDTQDRAYTRGKRAGVHANNPYPDGTENALAWGRGFEESHD